jgi:hypothetical protein
MLATGGCLGDHSRALPADQTDEEVAALMEDGELPDILKGDPTAPLPPPPPPRFCGGFPGGTGGRPGPTPPPVGGSGGSVDAGSTPGGPAPDPGPIPAPGPGPADAGAGGSTDTDGRVPDPGTGGTAGMGGPPDAGGGQGGSDPSCASVPIGFWRFDDCNTFRTDLNDSSFQGHAAFRNVALTCQPGQDGQAPFFDHTDDLIYTPDQPDFVLNEGVTVAAWVKPDQVKGVRTLFRKRDGNNSSFALVIKDGFFQFVIRLSSGKLASVSAPAKVGLWTHVGGTYDGQVLRLYTDGQEVAQATVRGTLARGVGPLLMGNDILGRRFEGLMDNAWFNTMAAPARTILELTCIPHDATATVTPAIGPAVNGGTPVTFELAITNNNGPTCPAASFQTFVQVPPGFSSEPNFTFIPPFASGTTATQPFIITSGEESEPDNYPLTFFTFANDGGRSTIEARAEYVVAEPTGCHVTSGRELTIRHVSVVDDPLRTTSAGPADDSRSGAWTFGRMMERLSPTTEAAPDVTEAMFRTFLTTQTINAFAVQPRPAMDPVVLNPWPRTPDGKLDLSRAPMRLLAIVNRLDLKDLEHGKAGEGRMVYGVLDPFGNQMQFTVILEYLLPGSTEAEFRAWADMFHGLQAIPFPSEEYNAALQGITDKFSGRNALPSAPNGSALIDIRTNEIALSFVWELREFHISPTTGFMDPAPLFLTPDSSFNGSETLGRFVNANEPTILTETHAVPALFEDAPFLSGAVFNNIDFWSAPNITNPEARHKFSLNTCNGCHGRETNTGFLQIFPRNPGQQSELSGFLLGTTVQDPITFQDRRFNELGRRRQLLESLVCPPAQP